MTGVGWAVLLGLGAAAASAGLSSWTLPRLTEPDPPDPPDKVSYRDLATPAFVLGVAGLTGAAAAWSAISLPGPVQPVWWVLAVGGVLLVAIDARTTWLPLSVTRTAWIAMVAGLAITVGLVDGDWAVPLRAGVGAALAGGVYWLAWRFSRGGLGFGDVRFAPLIGSAAAAHSYPLLFWALLLGSAAGGVQGMVRLVQRRPGSFPYAPAMLFGAYAACLTEWLR